MEWMSYSVKLSAEVPLNFFRFSQKLIETLELLLMKVAYRCCSLILRKPAFWNCLNAPVLARAAISISIYWSRSGRWCSCKRPRACRIWNYFKYFDFTTDRNYLMDKCMFFSTTWIQNNILSFTIPSSWRIATASMTKFYIVLYHGSIEKDN